VVHQSVESSGRLLLLLK